MNKQAWLDIITSLFILLFIYAGLSKWLDVNQFTKDINNQPFPNWATPFLVVLVPGLEILAAVCLLFDRSRLFGLYTSLFMMTGFSIYTAMVLLNIFKHVPCSCGGVIKQLSWEQHLLFNLFFVVIGVIGIINIKKQLS